jgi:predicted phage terminase large subunit-like protein
MVLPRPDIQVGPGVLNTLTAEHCRRSFYQFLVYFWDTIVEDEYQDNWHIKFICDEMQEAAERVFRNEPKEADLVINVPPGSSKSTICTIMFPAWCWVRMAHARFITGSYSSDLSILHAVKSRDILKSHKFQELFPGLIQFKKDMDGKTAYENTAKGSRHITSPGGTATGKHAHFIIVDDPINPELAFSEVERKKATRWMDKTMSSRKVNKKVTLTILVMQRLAEDDPTGHLLAKKGKKVRHICLPSEITDLDNVKPKEAEKFYRGGLLDPVRLDRSVLEESKTDLGSTDYAGQHLQSPHAAEGGIFKRAWFKYYQELPNARPIRTVHSWDTAYKAKQRNDYSCRTTWEQHANGHYVVDFWMEKAETPVLKIEIQTSDAAKPASAILIEDKASGQGLVQDLEAETTLPVIAIQPESDKIVRANRAAPTVQAGNIYLPLDKPWTAALVDKLCAFPGVKFDDDVDSFTQYINWVRSQPSGIPAAVTGGERATKKLLQGY